MKRLLAVFAVAAGIAAMNGCREQPKEPSPTFGPLQMVAASSVGALVDTLSGEFARIYPAIVPRVRTASAREAVVALLNDSVRTICIDRRLNAEEQRIADSVGMTIAETRIAWDALAVVVNAAHRLDSITIGTIADIVSGAAGRWSQVRGSSRNDAIVFVTTERNSGLYEEIQQRFVGADRPLKVAAAGETQSSCLEYVSRTPGALTIVSLQALVHRPGHVRVVPVAVAADSAAESPSQLAVYTRKYPLRTELMVYNAERRLGPGSGFAAFILTTQGQKLVQESGLVPEVLPYRVIQITSE